MEKLLKKDHSVFHHLIDWFAKTKILVIGDLMIDRFIRGRVSRISPEAPVPVVKVHHESNLPGGAGNVVMNIASLGGQVICCGVVGEDLVGRDLLSQFQSMGVETEGIVEDSSRPTILKTRVIAEHQQVVRFDFEGADSISHAEQEKIQDYVRKMMPQVDGVVLSDYGKGMITKSILTHAIQLARKHQKPICVDPKIEHFMSYKQVTCITPNLMEAVQGMRKVRLDGKYGIFDLGKEILKKLKCESVLITQGENGMTLFEKGKETHIQTKAQEVFDVTGAGDTVIAVFALSVACGASLIQAAMLSNLAAGVVVGKLGTATVTPVELKESLNRL